MTQSEIQHFFQQRYNRDAWVRFLGQAFLNASILSRPELLTGINTDVATQVNKLGFITLNEQGVERQIAIYEVTLAKGIVLERNRVGLRNLLRKYWKNIDAAFISFYNPESSNWRFTYVSELTGFDAEGEFISIKTEPKRYTYILGEGETCRTAAERFTLLVTKGKKAGLDDIKDAFSVEKLSKAFFDEYKSQYEDFVEFLTGKRIIKIDGDWQEKQIRQPSPQLAFIFHGSEKAARDFCKKMLGRIVFLYFIQKKGWLGVPVRSQWGEGNKNFVSDLFDKCRHKDIFYSEILTKLFFEALNRERDEDIIELINGITYRIPYLNGGLFEEENPEYRNLIFPAQLFQNLFAFFNQYNFTIYEDDPNDHTIAVDPEMLGHIFENLLEDNKDKGAYYTPKEIVHYMCQESLIEYITTWFEKRGYQITGYVGFNNPDQYQMFSVNEGRKGQMLLEYPNKTSTKTISRILIEKLLKKNLADNDKDELLRYYDEFQEALDTVKICDPAIGSGAFPMGLLHEIFNVKQLLHSFKYGKIKEFNAGLVKLNIIQNSIYGVDIEKGAVDIARLRFWLSLIIEESVPKPLPNLDYKIVVGNSLVSKFAGEVIDIDWNISARYDNTVKLKRDVKNSLDLLFEKQKLFFNYDGNKHDLQEEIRNLKIDVLLKQFELIKFLFKENNASQGTFFTQTAKEKVKALEDDLKISSINNAITKLKHLKTSQGIPFDFFDWKLNFPEVLNEQVSKDCGFDIVIANPPYLGEKGNKEKFREIKQGFLRDAYQAKMDIFYFFFHLGIKFSKLGGIITFITTNYYITADGAVKLRKLMKDETDVKQIINFNEFKIFDSALGQHNLITILQKGDSKRLTKLIVVKRKNQTGTTLLQNILSGVDSETDYLIRANIFDSDLNYIRIPIDSSSNLKSDCIFTKILSDSVSLGELVNINSGCDITISKITQKHLKKFQHISLEKDEGVFVINENEKNMLWKNLTDFEKTFVKRFIKSSDIEKFIHNYSEDFLLYIRWDTDFTLIPNIIKHLIKFRPILEDQAVRYEEPNWKWYSLHRPREQQIFDSAEKIIVPYRCIDNRFSISTKSVYSSRDVFYITKKDNTKLDIYSLCAVLNSKLVFYWLHNKGKKKGDTLELYATPLSQIPIKKKLAERYEQLNELTKKIIQLKPTGQCTEKIEKQINALVYKLYDIEFEDIKYIDKEFDMNESEYNSILL